MPPAACSRLYCRDLTWAGVFARSAILSALTQFFLDSSRIHTTIWMHHMDADKAYKEKASRQLYKNAASCNEKILEATFHETAAVWLPTSHF